MDRSTTAAVTDSILRGVVLTLFATSFVSVVVIVVLSVVLYGAYVYIMETVQVFGLLSSAVLLESARQTIVRVRTSGGTDYKSSLSSITAAHIILLADGTVVPILVLVIAIVYGVIYYAALVIALTAVICALGYVRRARTLVRSLQESPPLLAQAGYGGATSPAVGAGAATTYPGTWTSYTDPATAGWAGPTAQPEAQGSNGNTNLTRTGTASSQVLYYGTAPTTTGSGTLSAGTAPAVSAATPAAWTPAGPPPPSASLWPAIPRTPASATSDKPALSGPGVIQ
jgi:hypothetical protein